MCSWWIACNGWVILNIIDRMAGGNLPFRLKIGMLFMTLGWTSWQTSIISITGCHSCWFVIISSIELFISHVSRLFLVMLDDMIFLIMRNVWRLGYFSLWKFLDLRSWIIEDAYYWLEKIWNVCIVVFSVSDNFLFGRFEVQAFAFVILPNKIGHSHTCFNVLSRIFFDYSNYFINHLFL